MSRLLSLACLVLGLFAAEAGAATYYVSPSGSDANPGTAPTLAWRSVSKVNTISYLPGDTVLFEGGATFAGTTLMPLTSGTAAAPIRFSSYGNGQAVLSNASGAVWLPPGRNHLAFDNLHLTTGGAAVTIFADSGNAPGSSNIVLRNSTLSNTAAAAINARQPTDSSWLIEGNRISHTGDSALILLGGRHAVRGNTIGDVGWNTSIGWSRHGIYAKGPDMEISGNDISGVSGGQAVSIRFHGARVFGNAIHDTPYALAFFDYDTAAPPQGTSWIYANRLWNITGWGFYYDGQLDPNGNPPSVDFVLAGNTFRFSGATEAVNVSPATTANVTIVNNVFFGSYGSALRAPKPVAGKTFSEHHNVWWGASSNVPAGEGDLVADPGLGAAPGFAPVAGSRVVDAATTRAADLTYVAACEAKPLSYCGAAPEIGAVEVLGGSGGGGGGGGDGGGTADTTPPTAPTGLAVSAATRTSISLTWSPSTDDRGVTGYVVSRGGTAVGSTSSTSYADGGLACGTGYAYSVRARDAAGNLSAAGTLTATTSRCRRGGKTEPAVGALRPPAALATRTAKATGGAKAKAGGKAKAKAGGKAKAKAGGKAKAKAHRKALKAKATKRQTKRVGAGRRQR